MSKIKTAIMEISDMTGKPIEEITSQDLDIYLNKEAENDK